MNDLHRILSSEETLQPSPGFTARVMAAVHREAELPARLPFPWLRFAVGVTASGLMGAAATLLVSDFQAAVAPAFAPVAALAPELSYSAAALLIALGIAVVPRILARP